MDVDLLAQAVASGVLIGGLYATMSVGISLSWGALKIINLAHFSFILLGAYMTYQLTTSFGTDPFLVIIVVFPVFFLAGALLQVFFEWAKVDEFKSLLISFGLFIIFQSLARTIWTADFRRIGSENNPYDSASIFVGGVALQVPLISAFVAALIIAVGTSLLLARTHFGRAARAVVQDSEMARAFGIDPRRVAVVLSAMWLQGRMETPAQKTARVASVCHDVVNERVPAPEVLQMLSDLDRRMESLEGPILRMRESDHAGG